MPINMDQVQKQVHDRVADAAAGLAVNDEVTQALDSKAQWRPGEVVKLDSGRELSESDTAIWLSAPGVPAKRRVAHLHPLMGWVQIHA